MPRSKGPERERLLIFATRDVPFGTMHLAIGMALAELLPGEWLRIHIFSYTNNNGGEHPGGPIVGDHLVMSLLDVIKRAQMHAKVKRAGSDVLVGRIK